MAQQTKAKKSPVKKTGNGKNTSSKKKVTKPVKEPFKMKVSLNKDGEKIVKMKLGREMTEEKAIAGWNKTFKWNLNDLNVLLTLAESSKTKANVEKAKVCKEILELLFKAKVLFNETFE